jgi:hypothetical protein
MTQPKNEPVVTQANTLRDWLRRGGWLVPAAALTVAPVLASSFYQPPHYDALSRPASSADRLPPQGAERLAEVIAPRSLRMLGVADGTAYYLAAPARVSSGLCFIAADLADPDLSQAGCSGPGVGAGFQFADVALSEHRPGETWVEITEDVWRDTAYENLSSGDEDAERMPGRIG